LPVSGWLWGMRRYDWLWPIADIGQRRESTPRNERRATETAIILG
jgi:hypothetical protein